MGGLSRLGWDLLSACSSKLLGVLLAMLFFGVSTSVVVRSGSSNGCGTAFFLP